MAVKFSELRILAEGGSSGAHGSSLGSGCRAPSLAPSKLLADLRAQAGLLLLTLVSLSKPAENSSRLGFGLSC